jgi:hypothetical protein
VSLGCIEDGVQRGVSVANRNISTLTSSHFEYPVTVSYVLCHKKYNILIEVYLSSVLHFVGQITGCQIPHFEVAYFIGFHYNLL